MYENDYENYMRSVLGYPVNNTYNSFPYRNNVKNNCEQMYPEIYKTLKPIIQKTCGNVRNIEISNEIVDDLTNEIYNNIEVNKEPAKNVGNNRKIYENEPRAKRESNDTLKDLIRIMLVNQIIVDNQSVQSRSISPPYNIGNIF